MSIRNEEIKYVEIGLDEQNPPGFPYTYYALDLWMPDEYNLHEESVLLLAEERKYRSPHSYAPRAWTEPLTKVACTHNLSPLIKNIYYGFRGMLFEEFEKMATSVEKTPEMMAGAYASLPNDPIKILSVEECFDEDYGASIVQYSVDSKFVSFAFSNVDVNDPNFDVVHIKEELADRVDDVRKTPLWSDLSENHLEAVLRNPFDMCFIEDDDDIWTEEMADKLWDEVCKLGTSDAITCGEDGCLVTVYAGSMGTINWKGHPDYGVPCLHKIIEKTSGPALDQMISRLREIPGNERRPAPEKDIVR